MAGGLLSAALEEKPQETPRFESDILPIFEANCLACHGGEPRQGDLDLRTRDGLLRGGRSGVAIVPGLAEESLLLEKIVSGAMPMAGEKLSPDQIERVRRWISAGALEEGEEHKAVSVRPREVTGREVMVNILQVKCLLCHGRRRQEGGLDMRTRTSLLKGGKSGAAIIPGKPEQSLLIQRIVAEEMPPPELQARRSIRPVTSSELEKLRQWVVAGAPAEEEEVLEMETEPDPLVRDEDRRFWSFNPPQPPSVPEVNHRAQLRTAIDAFLLEKLEALGLAFSDEADRLVLMRRAYFDLIGLPPEPEEIEDYLADHRLDAYDRLLDRLLSSPRYGERWARYWLDAAGYSDSEGKVSADAIRPYAYRYRDYVIRSFNQDKPYDRFLVEQIAGDELFDYGSTRERTAGEFDSLVATGFLRMAPDGTYSTSQIFIPQRLDVVADEVQVLSSTVMGLTVACARCHDHKYDPIPQRDYYRLSAILRSAYDPYDWLSPGYREVGPAAKWEDSDTRFLPSFSEKERREVEEYNAPILEEIESLERTLESKARPLRKDLLAEKLTKLPEGLQKDARKAFATPAENRSNTQEYLVEKLKVGQEQLKQRFEDFGKEAQEIEEAVAEAQRKLRRGPKVRALYDMGGQPTPVHLLRRGDYLNPGKVVRPGVPSVLRKGISPFKVVKPPWTTNTSGRRLALARWLVQPNHPLTTRVMVNRIWKHHFGKGLVETVGNFGRLGAKPSHPELLDWLAAEFVRQGWRIKFMHKLIMTSTAYRQSSRFNRERYAPDAQNILLSRFPLRRLDADAIRDSVLKVAGRLDTTPFGRPDQVEVESDGEVVGKGSQAGFRRSIYLLQRRSTPPTFLEAFDMPQLNPNCLERAHSMVSSQALEMMNSDLVRESSRYMAGRLIDEVGGDVEKQVERAYLRALSRWPSSQEGEIAAQTLRRLDREWRRHLEKEVRLSLRQPGRNGWRWPPSATHC